MEPLGWFFAQIFPSISSVSTEQSRICVKNSPESQKRCKETRRSENLESLVIPTEFPIANTISQIDVEVLGYLLQRKDIPI